MSSLDKLSNDFHAAGTNGRLDLSLPGEHPAARPTVHAVHDIDQCFSTFLMLWTTFGQDFVLGPTS